MLQDEHAFAKHTCCNSSEEECVMIRVVSSTTYSANACYQHTIDHNRVIPRIQTATIERRKRKERKKVKQKRKEKREKKKKKKKKRIAARTTEKGDKQKSNKVANMKTSILCYIKFAPQLFDESNMAGLTSNGITQLGLNGRRILCIHKHPRAKSVESVLQVICLIQNKSV